MSPALGARPRLPPGAGGHLARASFVAVVALGAFWILARHAGGARHTGLDARAVAAVASVEAGTFEGAMVLFSFLGAGVGLLLMLTPLLVGLVRRAEWRTSCSWRRRC